jgi:hypothetical protein
MCHFQVALLPEMQWPGCLRLSRWTNHNSSFRLVSRSFYSLLQILIYWITGFWLFVLLLLSRLVACKKAKSFTQPGLDSSQVAFSRLLTLSWLEAMYSQWAVLCKSWRCCWQLNVRAAALSRVDRGEQSMTFKAHSTGLDWRTLWTTLYRSCFHGSICINHTLKSLGAQCTQSGILSMWWWSWIMTGR